MNATKPLKLYTLEEFQAMPKEEGWNYELIDGFVLMSPSPSREHQRVGSRILIKIGNQLEHTPCEPSYELDVISNGCVFKPDLLVFCDEAAELPEIIFEILSPSTRHRDLRIKLVKYELMGVKEYWIVDPKSKTITIHDFINNTAEIYLINDIAKSLAQPEIQIALTDIFA